MQNPLFRIILCMVIISFVGLYFASQKAKVPVQVVQGKLEQSSLSDKIPVVSTSHSPSEESHDN